MILEREIETYFRKEVKNHGGLSIKFTSSSLRSLPDRLNLFPGALTLFVEVKRPGRKPTDKQKRMIKRLQRLGYIAVWLDGRPRVDALFDWLRKNKGLVRNVPQKRRAMKHVPRT